MKLRQYAEERGLDDEEIAALLESGGVVSSKSKKPVTPHGVRAVLGRDLDVPPAWAGALGVELEAPTPGREKETVPKAPKDAKIEKLAQDLVQSPTRIAGAYRFLGGMLAQGSGSPGVARVWDDSADQIAALWVKAAEQNPWAARFVTMMNSGGTMGDLAGAHLYLAGATLYVLGANVPAGDGLFAKYRGYRPVITVEPPAETVEGANGAGPDGAVVPPPVAPVG